MPRIKIELPKEFSFSCTVPIRITDLNYGGHVGNDTVLSLIHEARMQYLRSLGYSELNFGGVGLIMSDVAIEFKNELFYGDTVKCSIAATEIGKVNFELTYMLETTREGKDLIVALAKTGMVCYNYEAKKIAAISETAVAQLKK